MDTLKNWKIATVFASLLGMTACSDDQPDSELAESLKEPISTQFDSAPTEPLEKPVSIPLDNSATKTVITMRTGDGSTSTPPVFFPIYPTETCEDVAKKTAALSATTRVIDVLCLNDENETTETFTCETNGIETPAVCRRTDLGL